MVSDSKPALMVQNRFSDASPGHLVPVRLGKRTLSASGVPKIEPVDSLAFIPHALPPTIDWSVVKATLFNEFTAASAALGRVNGLQHALPNREILHQALWLREAKLSSQIEGIHTTALDMVLAGSHDDATGDNPGREAFNAMLAVRYGLQSPLPYSGRLIREMHQRLLQGVRGERDRPGEFRDIPAFIGREDHPELARFVPPPSDSTKQVVTQCISDLEQFVNEFVSGKWSEIPTLAAVAMSHYQFEAIHPFRDGNGRIGRALILHQLCNLNMLEVPIVSVSGHFQRNRMEYVDRLFAVSADGDWIGWIKFFTEGIAREAGWTQLLAERIIRLYNGYSDKLREQNAAGRLFRLLDHVFGWPLVTASSVVKLLEVTDPTARKDIGVFEELGILALTEDVRWGKTWYAPAVLDVAEAEYEEFPE